MKPVKRILITGASGCLGHYLVDDFLHSSPHELLLLVRDRSKLSESVQRSPRVTIVDADLSYPAPFFLEPDHLDAAVLAAACWGGKETMRVNVESNQQLVRLLSRNGCRRFIYFSTASVLDRENKLLTAALELGTDYIRSKYLLTEAMEQEFSGFELTGIFPTLLIGGGTNVPYSHFSRLLMQAAPWYRLGRHLRAEGAFHLIHCRDVARVVSKLIDDPLNPAKPPQRLVLGNPAVTLNDFIEQFCLQLGRTSKMQVALTNRLASLLIRLFRIKLSAWDRYCLLHRHQTYSGALNPAALGLPVFCPDAKSLLNSIGIGKLCLKIKPFGPS